MLAGVQRRGELHTQATGTRIQDNSKTISYRFDRYIVKVRLGPTNEFLGIVEISLNKDFLSQEQRLLRLTSIPSGDADEFYLAEEEE